VRHADAPGARRRRHQAAVAALDHVRHDRPEGVEHPGEVHRDHVVPLLGGELGHRAGAADAGVGDDDIDLAELGDRLRDRGLHRGAVADVGRDGERASPGLLDELRGLLQLVTLAEAVRHRRDVAAQVGDHHIGAGVGQRHRVGATLPARPAGDERNTTVELSHDPAHLAWPAWSAWPTSGLLRRECTQRQAQHPPLVGPQSPSRPGCLA
jgi:hypothetical protein